MKTYCVNVIREIEEPYIFHFKINDDAPEPTRNEVLKLIDAEDVGHDDNYGKFSFWEV